ncbi:Tim44/TimA family putative adaptor protein [Neomegalonema perideroedes]|uniref:Tim44/TimA family putative adaptor protein n=1 Tax=Neomegalonema perideroedes TaxID=217219 RepID=UPI00036DDF11|nr:Tim44/TimA family putative adaptor protein [Neomegalonema perideroedes]
MTDAFLEILILAAVAGFVFMRLKGVLGTRVGRENPEEWGFGAPSGKPGPAADRAEAAPGLPPELGVDPASPAGRALILGLEADSEFDPADFMRRAGDAYEYILLAFEHGEKDDLRPLLAPNVYQSFSHVIDDRTQKGVVVEARLVRILATELKDARFDPATREMQMDVRFEAELISAARDAAGAVVQGDPTQPRVISDLWTFSRRLGDADPNWLLVATGD